MRCDVHQSVCLLMLVHAARATNATATGLKEWISQVRIPIGNVDDGDTQIENLEVFGLQFSNLDVDQRGKTSVVLQLSDLRILASIGKITNKDDSLKQWIVAGGTIVLENIEVELIGTFSAETSIVLDDVFMRMHRCAADLEVNVFKADIRTSGGLAAIDPTGKVKAKIEEVARDEIVKQFKETVCGADALTKQFQGQIDELIRQADALAVESSNEHDREQPLESAVEWGGTKVCQWLQRFSEHAASNGFSWDAVLQPLFANGMGGCLFGSDIGCLTPTPEAVSNALNVQSSTTSSDGIERQLNLRIENANLLLQAFNVNHANLLTENGQHPQWLGFNASIGPINFTFVGELVIVALNYGPVAPLRQNFTLHFGIDHFDVDTFFLYEIDDKKYRALSDVQRASPVCLDGIRNRFGLQTLHMSLHMQQIALTMEQSGQKAEDRFVRSVQDLLNLLVVCGINNNGPVIDKFVQAVVRPGLEVALGTEDSLHGHLTRMGIKFWDGTDCGTSSPAGDQTKQAVACLLLVTCLAGTALKVCAPQPEADGSCLITKKSTELHWRVVVPLLMVAALLLLIVSNTMVAATMRIYLLLDDAEPTAVKDLNQFSVVESISDLWNNGAKFLAILIFFFSLVFPYVKLLLCLCLLIVPMTDHHRGVIAHVVDAVGKMSLLDAFALMFIVVLASFEVHFKGGSGIAMFIELGWGFQAFLGGTILCMLVGHLTLMLHHFSAKVRELEGAGRAAFAGKRSLTPFTLGGPEGSANCREFAGWLCVSSEPISIVGHDVSRSPRCAAYCYICALLAVGIGLAIASFMKLTVLEVDGLFGWFLNWVHETNVKVNSDEQLGVVEHNVFEFSLVTLGYALGEKSAGTTPGWTAALQASYFAFTVIFVMLFHVVGFLLCIWILTKQKLETTKKPLVILKLIGSTLFAWGAIDVFTIGAFVTVIEMGEGSFVATPTFWSRLISNLRTSLVIPGDEDVVIALRPKLCAGAYLIFVGALTFLGVGVQFIRFLGRLQVLPHRELRPADECEDMDVPLTSAASTDVPVVTVAAA